MEKIERVFCFVSSGIGAACSAFIGDVSGPVIALIIFIFADIVTGLAKGIKSQRLSSRVAFHGMMRKCAIFIMVGVGNILDAYVLIGESPVIKTAVIFFYLAEELISIIENTEALGLPVPAALRKAIGKLKGDGENE